MHPVRGIGIGAVGFGALVAAFWFGQASSWALEPDLELALRGLASSGVAAAFVGGIMMAWPGHRPQPWDFEDWLEELSWAQRGLYLGAVIAGLPLGLWLFEPWRALGVG